jgi:hypothetical protein
VSVALKTEGRSQLTGTFTEFMFGTATQMSNEGKETVINIYFREFLTVYCSVKSLYWGNSNYGTTQNTCVMPGNPTTNPSH